MKYVAKPTNITFEAASVSGEECSTITTTKRSMNLPLRRTETNKKACTWLREFSSCLTPLSGLAWVLLSKIYIPFYSPLYRK